MAIHVSIDRRNQYFRRYEAACVFGIPGAWHFVFPRNALGLRYIRVVRPTLFSRECRLPIKSAAVRTHPQHNTGGLLVNQLCAYRTVHLVLPNDKRTISHVAVVGIRLGSGGLHCNGDPSGSSGGHQRDRTLPLARSDFRRCRGPAWVRHSLSLE